MISNILFDLDGTLTDSQEGIVKCIRYSMNKLGQSCLTELELKELIGISLRATFEILLGSHEISLIEKAVDLYRERYTEIGILENQVYPGVVEVLSTLYDNSYKLYIVTTKPKIFADRIARHFHLDQWFVEIFGTGMDGSFDNKTKHIEFILSHLQLRPEETIMVGDRNEDIVSGKANRLKTIGVTYGYGSRREILDSGPDFICDRPVEILNVIDEINLPDVDKNMLS
jgi:phosphoglycolate phosphatase